MKWKFWKRAEPTPQGAMTELLELTVKAARRCAYDLAHAADMVKDDHFRPIYRDRARHWLKVFNPADGPKDYRARLHYELDMKDMEIERLKSQLMRAGVEPEEQF